jgi:hypothetical protein
MRSRIHKLYTSVVSDFSYYLRMSINYEINGFSAIFIMDMIGRTLFYFIFLLGQDPMLGGIPVSTAWRVLGLRMEERPPDMEVSCEYIE